jgi:hypothetical protein
VPRMNLSGIAVRPQATSAGPPVGGKFPIPTHLIMSQDVHVAVVGVDFEPALRWREPAINHGAYGQSALTEPESKRLLFAAIARVALDANRHTITILLYLVPCTGHWRTCLFVAIERVACLASASSGCSALRSSSRRSVHSGPNRHTLDGIERFYKTKNLLSFHTSQLGTP